MSIGWEESGVVRVETNSKVSGRDAFPCLPYVPLVWEGSA